MASGELDTDGTPFRPIRLRGHLAKETDPPHRPLNCNCGLQFNERESDDTPSCGHLENGHLDPLDDRSGSEDVGSVVKQDVHVGSTIQKDCLIEGVTGQADIDSNCRSKVSVHETTRRSQGEYSDSGEITISLIPGSPSLETAGLG